MLLATWQLIACSHGIVVLLFCDPTPLTRLCNNPPSRGGTTSTQSSQQSTESSDAISPERCSQSSDQSTQPSQSASKSRKSPNAIQQSTDSPSLLPSQQSSLSGYTAFSAIFRIFRCGLSSSVFFTTVFAVF